MSRRSEKNNLDESTKERVGKALGRVPSGVFVLTARHEDHSMGMLASWVQQVSFEPAMITVAVAKGRSIMPLISESRHFGLCQLPVGDKIITRKFAASCDINDDPFLGFEMNTDTVTRVPILANIMSYLECEVTCHVDVEGDHDLFVGTIRGGNFLQGEPWIHLRDSGFKY